MSTFRYITVPPINQLFVTIWIRLKIENLETLMMLPYRRGGMTVMNPLILDQIKEEYALFIRTSGSHTVQAIEDFFSVNIIRAKLGEGQNGDYYNIQPYEIRHQKERFNLDCTHPQY